MRNKYIQLIPADVSFAWQVADYYSRNKKFLEEFEPKRSEEFFSLEYQKEILKKEMLDYKEKRAFRFYIKLVEQPEKIIGLIGLNNVVWGAFCSAFLGYITRCTNERLPQEPPGLRRGSDRLLCRPQ